jgi:hypothetical protein
VAARAEIPETRHAPLREDHRSREEDVAFGLLCTAQAGSDDLPAETGQGFRDYLDFNGPRWRNVELRRDIDADALPRRAP